MKPRHAYYNEYLPASRKIDYDELVTVLEIREEREPYRVSAVIVKYKDRTYYVVDASTLVDLQEAP